MKKKNEEIVKSVKYGGLKDVIKDIPNHTKIIMMSSYVAMNGLVTVSIYKKDENVFMVCDEECVYNTLRMLGKQATSQEKQDKYIELVEYLAEKYKIEVFFVPSKRRGTFMQFLLSDAQGIENTFNKMCEYLSMVLSAKSLCDVKN